MDKLKKIIDKIENESFSTQNKYWIDESWLNELKELINEKWEPKGGQYFVYPGGKIQYNADGYSDDAREYGNEFPTKELAETARDMNKRNQLILQAKHEMGYGGGKFYISRGTSGFWQASLSDWVPDPEISFETQTQAETVIKMVNLNG